MTIREIQATKQAYNRMFETRFHNYRRVAHCAGNSRDRRHNRRRAILANPQPEIVLWTVQAQDNAARGIIAPPFFTINPCPTPNPS